MTLRDYQRHCVDRVMEDLQADYRVLGVIAPCSAGKTIIFINIAKEYLRLNPTKKIMIMSTLSILTDQTTARFKTFAPELKIGILQADQTPDKDCQVVIATVQSAKDEAKIMRWAWSKDTNVGLIIGDEIHSLIATEQFRKAIEQHNAKVVGFSASFYREAMLITNLFDRISYQISAQELIDAKWLLPIKLQQVMVPKEAEFETRAAIFLKLYKEQLVGKKTFVFCRTVEEAFDMASLFNSHGIRTAFVTGGVVGQIRRDLMNRFENEDIDVITTCNVLSQGVDSQKLEAILDIYGTGSPTLFIQRSGRLARTEDGGQVTSEHKKQFGTYYTAASAPEIKSGFYKKLLEYSLNEGKKDRKNDIFDQKEYLDLMLEPKDSQTYRFTETLCRIAEEFKRLGLTNIFDMVRQKQIPERYLRSLDLVEIAFKNSIVKDSWEAVEKAIREGIVKEDGKEWILPSGKQAGRHIKDVSYFYKEWLRKNAPNSYAAKLLVAWENRNKQKLPNGKKTYQGRF